MTAGQKLADLLVLEYPTKKEAADDLGIERTKLVKILKSSTTRHKGLIEIYMKFISKYPEHLNTLGLDKLFI